MSPARAPTIAGPRARERAALLHFAQQAQARIGQSPASTVTPTLLRQLAELMPPLASQAALSVVKNLLADCALCVWQECRGGLSVFHLMHELLASSRTDECRLAALDLAVRLEAALGPAAAGRPPARDPRIALALQIIRERCGEPDLTLADLAGAAGLSRSRFVHLFKRTTGSSSRAQIRACRMRRAASLIRDSELLIKQVAISVGYRSVGSFSRDFRAHFGVSPTAARTNLTPPMRIEKTLHSGAASE